MPFYEALKYLLTTASGNMISRKKWKSGSLIKCQSFSECTKTYKYTISYVSSDYCSNTTVYNLTSEDIVADDWYIVNQEND